MSAAKSRCFWTKGSDDMAVERVWCLGGEGGE